MSDKKKDIKSGNNIELDGGITVLNNISVSEKVEEKKEEAAALEENKQPVINNVEEKKEDEINKDINVTSTTPAIDPTIIPSGPTEINFSGEIPSIVPNAPVEEPILPNINVSNELDEPSKQPLFENYNNFEFPMNASKNSNFDSTPISQSYDKPSSMPGDIETAIGNLRDEVMKAVGNNLQLKDEVNRLSLENSDLKNQLEKVTSDNANLRATISDMQSKVSNMQARVLDMFGMGGNINQNPSNSFNSYDDLNAGRNKIA